MEKINCKVSTSMDYDATDSLQQAGMCVCVSGKL